MSPGEVRRMYEFSALDCGSGPFLVAWGCRAQAGVATGRPGGPLAREGLLELRQRRLLRLARENLPRLGSLRRSRARVGRDHRDDFEDVGAVADETVGGCLEDAGFHPVGEGAGLDRLGP